MGSRRSCRGSGGKTESRRLKELLPAAFGKDPLHDFVADYPLNLVEVRSFPEPGIFRSDLREVFTFLQKDNDKEHLKQYVLDNQAVFDDIAGDAYDLLAVMSNVEILKERKERYKNEGRDTWQMCKALTDWVEEERAEGRKEGCASTTTRLNSLNRQLISAGRIADLSRACADSAFQNKLLREYGL